MISRYPKEPDLLTNILVLTFVMCLGLLIGHFQANHWNTIEQNALKSEIELAKCEDIRFPDVIRTVRHETKIYPIKKKQHQE